MLQELLTFHRIEVNSVFKLCNCGQRSGPRLFWGPSYCWVSVLVISFAFHMEESGGWVSPNLGEGF